jgi:hypothetical protein
MSEITVPPGATLVQDPDAKIVRVFDWSDWLGSTAQIASATVTLDSTRSDGTDLTIDDDDIVDVDGRSVQVRFSAAGGTVGKKYVVTCHIETDEAIPQSDDRSITIRIQQA